MDRYAVLGHPVGHSLSPRIHAAFAQATGLELEYGAIDIAPDAFTQTLDELHTQGYCGFNVTVPHKLAAHALARQLSERARHAGAVNTLLRVKGGWNGDNTDGTGLLADLQRNLGLQLAGKRIAVLGAGGAARGIIAPLLETKPAQLIIANRSPDKAQHLAQQFAGLGNVTPSIPEALAGENFDLVINATSAGHRGQAPALATGLFGSDATAYDLNYGPASKPFLGAAARCGATHTRDGLGMLVEQAAESFRLWRGLRPDTTRVLAMLRTG